MTLLAAIISLLLSLAIAGHTYRTPISTFTRTIR
jgi:hypothetical protein